MRAGRGGACACGSWAAHKTCPQRPPGSRQALHTHVAPLPHQRRTQCSCNHTHALCQHLLGPHIHVCLRPHSPPLCLRLILSTLCLCPSSPPPLCLRPLLPTPVPAPAASRPAATPTLRRRSSGCAPSCCARTRTTSAWRWRWRPRRRSASGRRCAPCPAPVPASSCRWLCCSAARMGRPRTAAAAARGSRHRARAAWLHTPRRFHFQR